MIGELTSIDKIRISARLFAMAGFPITVNPYPVGSDAHKEWMVYWTLADFEESEAV